MPLLISPFWWLGGILFFIFSLFFFPLALLVAYMSSDLRASTT